MGKLINARIREGRIEPTESVQLPPEGTEVLVSLEEANRANEWFRDLHALFAPVRAELAAESEEAINERIARTVKTTRTRKRGKA
jgi:hypothetical protein